MTPFLKIVAPRELLMIFWSMGTIIIGFPVKLCMKMMILRIFDNGSNFEGFGS